MLAYFAWNVVSAFLPHTFPAAVPTTGEPIVVYRFILTGTVLPFVAFVVGRALIRDLGPDPAAAVHAAGRAPATRPWSASCSSPARSS